MSEARGQSDPSTDRFDPYSALGNLRVLGLASLLRGRSMVMTDLGPRPTLVS